MRFFVATGSLLVVCGVANGQLLVGNDDTAVGADNAWNVDVGSGTSVALWGGAEVWGMAYDAGSNTVFANDGTLLRYGTLGSGAPTNEVTIVDAAGAAQSMVGLGWARGSLYATKNIANEAIWIVDHTTGLASVFFDYVDADYDFGGLAFNPADGLFYGTNDDASPHGTGLYSIDAFGSGAITLITPYPAGETDIDGLAIGNGVAYLVEDEAGDSIHPFDLAAGVYLADITSPMVSSEVFSGAAFVPAPAPLALLGLAGFASRRRR